MDPISNNSSLLLRQVDYPSTRHFTPESVQFQLRSRSSLGIRLSDARNRNVLQDLEGRDAPLISQSPVPVKSSIRIQPLGYSPFGKQKNVRRRCDGAFVSVTRAKAVQLVAEVVEEFIAEAQNIEELADGALRFGQGHIQLENLVLLELHRVSPGSFQPVLAVIP